MKSHAASALLVCFGGLAACSIDRVDLFGDRDAGVADNGSVKRDATSGPADANGVDADPLDMGVADLGMLKCPETISATVTELWDEVDLDQPIEVAASKDWAWVMYKVSGASEVYLDTYFWPLESWRGKTAYSHEPPGGHAQLTTLDDDAASVATIRHEESSRRIYLGTQTDIDDDDVRIDIESNETLSDMVRTPDAFVFFLSSSGGGRLLYYYMQEHLLDSRNRGGRRFPEIYFTFASPVLWMVEILKESSWPFVLTRMRGVHSEGTEGFGSCAGRFVTGTDFVAIDGERIWLTWRCEDQRLVNNKSVRLSEDSYWVDQEENDLELAYDGATVGALGWSIFSKTPSINFYDPHDSTLLSGRNLALDVPRPADGRLVDMDLAGHLGPDGKMTRWIAAFAFETDAETHTGSIYAATFTGCYYE